jgi:hypothetical protein
MTVELKTWEVLKRHLEEQLEDAFLYGNDEPPSCQLIWISW